MQTNPNSTSIFKKGSTTFFTSSLFFPKNKLQDITDLYAFVRVADDFVDSVPADSKSFFEFKNEYLLAVKTRISDNSIIQKYIDLEYKYKFEHSWTVAFLQSMEQDLTKNTYQNIDETKQYIYGSANVVGLFMCKILDLDDLSHAAAEKLGMAFQFINFIRDINEDIELNRNYFPQDLLIKYEIKSLEFEFTKQNPENFKNFVNELLEQYHIWYKEGQEGYKFIQKKYLVAIKTASMMYDWTAKQIAKDPFVVYQKKVKPPKWLIVAYGLKNLIS